MAYFQVGFPWGQAWLVGIRAYVWVPAAKEDEKQVFWLLRGKVSLTKEGVFHTYKIIFKSSRPQETMKLKDTSNQICITAWLFETLGAPRVKSETGPCTWKARKVLRKRPSRLVGGNFNKSGNVLTRLVFGVCDGVDHAPTRSPNLKSLYRDLNCVQSVYSPVRLNNTLLPQGCNLENGSHCGNSSQSRAQLPRELGVRCLCLWVNLQSHPLQDLLQHGQKC